VQLAADLMRRIKLSETKAVRNRRSRPHTDDTLVNETQALSNGQTQIQAAVNDVDAIEFVDSVSDIMSTASIALTDDSINAIDDFSCPKKCGANK
jgi:hypothetical protein